MKTASQCFAVRVKRFRHQLSYGPSLSGGDRDDHFSYSSELDGKILEELLEVTCSVWHQSRFVAASLR
ncbi:MAG: hypothetical protein BGP25_10280 [Lysobacterales bacterium 63-13]|nr:MAG: hypothetical protein BGP25_10280 [Xanthomonadales bacterium 63-13]